MASSHAPAASRLPAAPSCRRVVLSRARAQSRSGESPPAWAGEDWVSRGVNAMISTPVVFDVMKQLARNVMTSSAEKKGITWRDNVRTLEGVQQAEQDLYEHIEDPSVEYPDYYLQQFHGYEEGNLSWRAAHEVESATMVMATRVWPEEQISWQDAQRRLRDGYCENIHTFVRDHVGDGAREPGVVLDCGCSTGISTFCLAASFPAASRVVGLDLSPYFLAVAKMRAQNYAGQGQEAGVEGGWMPPGLTGQASGAIEWVHGLAEDTKFEAGSVDLFSLSFVTHECPQDATRSFFSEAFKVLRPGGVLCMCDNDPQSSVIRNLPPAIFTLMKATEPWSDDYYTLDMQGAMREAGFVHTRSVLMDPRHRIVLALKPASG